MTNQSPMAERPAAAKGHWPGEPALWSLLCSDLLLFAAMFIAFAVERRGAVAMFHASAQSMSLAIGVVNTLLLLVSSRCVVAAVAAARAGKAVGVRSDLSRAMALGAVFVLLKIVEYRSKLVVDIGPQTNLFFTYYFTLTGIHLFHVLVGLVALGLLALRFRTAAIGPRDIELLESGASFWHLVDLLWIMLFALLYLAG